MAKVFIAGSISQKSIPDAIEQSLIRIIEKGIPILIGDAEGFDSTVQEYLKNYKIRSTGEYTNKVTVFFSENNEKKPRNNLGEWRTQEVIAPSQIKDSTKKYTGGRKLYQAKDEKMAEEATYGLFSWDLKSAGTFRNMCELVKKNKKGKVCVAASRELISFATKDHLNQLLEKMDSADKKTLEKKLTQKYLKFLSEETSLL